MKIFLGMSGVIRELEVDASKSSIQLSSYRHSGVTSAKRTSRHNIPENSLIDKFEFVNSICI